MTGFTPWENTVSGLQPAMPTHWPISCSRTSRSFDACVKALTGPSTPLQIAGGAQVCSTRSRSARSPAKRHLQPPTCVDFKANVEGSQTAVASVRSSTSDAEPQACDHSSRRNEKPRRSYRQAMAVSYDKVTEPQRQNCRAPSTR